LHAKLELRAAVRVVGGVELGTEVFGDAFANRQAKAEAAGFG